MTNKKLNFCYAFSLLLVLLPLHVNANAVWPSLYLVTGMLSWYVIISGFIMETIFIKIFTKETVLKSALISFVMNLVSAVIGVFAIPISGFIVEVLLIPSGTGTFHPTHWILSYIFAVFCNVFIEGLVLKLIFKYKFKNIFLWLLSANAISVIICIIFHGFKM